MSILNRLPLWFDMVIIVIIVVAVIYRLVRYGVKIKAGPIEIDAETEIKEETKE